MFKVNGRGETPLHRCQGSEVEHLIREIAASGGYYKQQCVFVKSFAHFRVSLSLCISKMLLCPLSQVNIFLFLFIYLFICLFICLFIYLFVY